MSAPYVPVGPSIFRPPREALDPRVRTWWRCHLVAWPAAAVVVLVVLASLLPAAALRLVAAAAAVALLAAAAAVVLPGRWYRRHRWEYTDDAVYVRGGLLWLGSRAAPLSRVQTVDTSRGPIQQWCGIATLVVTTASGAVRVAGIDDEHASALAAALTRRTQAVPADPGTHPVPAMTDGRLEGAAAIRRSSRRT
jgi:hypothetical protein